MSRTDYTAWAHQRIEAAAALHAETRRELVALFDTWMASPALSHALSERTSREAVLHVLELVLSGYVETPEADEAVEWQQARNGALRVGDVVKVKPDAYAGAAGAYHNGRICRIVAMRYGDIIVRDDSDPSYAGQHHQAAALLRRVK